MSETIVSSRYGKPLTLAKQVNRGGQGRIFETDDPCLLVKQFEPSFITHDPVLQEVVQRNAARAYPAFSQVNKATHVELKSLPREFVRVHSKPAYVMEKAEGQLLQALLRDQALTLPERLRIALALARALALLHAAQMIHTDVHPDNYIVFSAPTGWIVIVIDIDGGGLLSPPGPIDPMSQPKRVYKAPELFIMKWPELRAKGLFFDPDRWALAVLLYQLLVDYQGPFCSAATHPDQSITNYTPYAPFAYRDPEASWPLPWQEALFKRTSLPDPVVSLFYTTFQHRFLCKEQRSRPAAADWEAALVSAITPPPPVPVSTLRVPPPPPLRGPAPPSARSQGWAAKARRMCLSLGVRLTRALRCALVPRYGALRWLPAVAGVIGLGHPAFIAPSQAEAPLVRPILRAGEDVAPLSNLRGHIMLPTPAHNTSPVSLAPKSFATASASPVVLKEREEEIIRACALYQYLTVVDLCFVLGLPTSRNYVRRLAARLAGNTDHAEGHYLYRFALPQRSGGNALRVYVPGAASQTLFLVGPETEGFVWNNPAVMQGYSYSYVLHNLAVTRLAICAALVCQDYPAYYLAETRLCYEMAATPPRLNLGPEGQEATSAVIPDLWVSLRRIGSDSGHALWFEVDNATEAKTAFQRRLRARLKLIESEAYTAYFGTPAVCLLYAVVGKDEKLRCRRLETLCKWTTDLLTQEGLTHWASTFYFTTIEYETLYAHRGELFFAPVWHQPDQPRPVALLSLPFIQETPHDSKTLTPSLVPTKA